MQFRKICQHPFLFEQVEDEINPGGYINDKIVRSSGKFELLSRILPKLFKTGHRVNNLHWFPFCLLADHRFLGFDLFPNDKSDGHHGGLHEVDELGISPT